MTKCILLISFLFIFYNVGSQPDLKFIRYTTGQGLASNDILCIHQDHLGFLWFGTKNGCSRFDGLEFKNYQYDENIPGSIGEGWVNKIVRDNENNLWLAISGAESTFMKYDYETDQFVDLSSFIRAKLNIENEAFNIRSVFYDNQGYLWFFSVHQGIMYYDIENREVKTFNEYNNIPSPLSIIRSAVEGIDHNMWFASSKGFFVYNRKSNSFKEYKYNPNDVTSISSDNCNSVYIDSYNQIWVGTDVGLNKVVQDSSKSILFKRYIHEPQNPYSLSHNLVYDIAEDRDSNLLIATVNGLCLLDKKSEKIYSYFNDEMDDESINSNAVRSVYCDLNGNIWIATNAGVGKSQLKNFKTFSHSSYKNSISHNKVEFLYEDQDSKIWIATPKGIDIYNREKKQFRNIVGVSRGKKGLNGSPLTLCPDADKGMWIGTYNGSLNYFDYTTDEVTNYINNSAVRSPSNVFSVLKDSKNNLWFDSQGEGVFVQNLKTGEYRLLSHDKNNENTLSSNWGRIIKEDSDSNIWIGTINGLNKLIDFQEGTFRHYLKGLEIYCVVETSNKHLWIGTNKGLYQLNKVTQYLRKYNSYNGFPSDIVLGILEDEEHNLWISTGKGIVKFKPTEDIPINITVHRQEEGLAVGSFIAHSSAKLFDGTMVFGGTKGFVMFHPMEVKNDTIPPTVVFTGLKVVNKEVKVGQEINNQVILKKSITTTNSLILNHKNNAFSIEFAGIRYNMPQYNRYCYKLEGYDPKDAEWHYINSNDRKAEYMNLPRGVYTFKVKAANSYDVWNNKPAELKITILPPWWRTVWFISTTVTFLVLLVILIIRKRTYNLNQQKQKLEKIVEQRTTELKEMNVILREGKEELEVQMEQMAKMNKEIESMAKQLHEADQSKLRFFANISHEFRTPLSLIISPLEKYLNINAEQPIDSVKVESGYLKLMHRNAKRLLRLINQVIDFRKMDQGEKKLRISNNNIEEFIKEITDAFSTHAESKNIDLKYTIKDLGFEKDNQLIINSEELVDLSDQKSSFYNNFWFDSDIIEKILYNLISNAIKYTQEGGEVSIQLSVNNKQSTVSSNQLSDNEKLLTIHSSLFIKVSDTGIGIKKENLEKIFDRFYRVETEESRTDEGTGIGLSYTKELVELHKGSILAESEPGKGTTFILQFPIGKEYFEEGTISDNSASMKLDYTHSMIEQSDVSKTLITKQEEQNEEKEQILLVEDNNDLRNFIQDELKTEYEVLIAENGKKGWEIALKSDPQLILSDIMMPVMDGIELCKRIKTDENTSHIPVILLTAKSGEENMLEGLETGADDYISKPFNINILKAKIHNLFQLQKRIREKFSRSIDVVPSEIGRSVIDKEFIQKALQVISEHMEDTEFDNDAFVGHMNYSRALIYRKIKNLTGQSVGEFIRDIRLKTAAQLFIEGNDNIAQVCYRVGFKHQTFLTRHFKKMFGKTPTQFIKERLKRD